MPDDRMQTLLGAVDALVPEAQEFYTDLHAHPELSMQEHRTAERAAARLADAGFEVTTGVGGTGVVGVLRNGDGPTVALRADMDALPVREDTGLPYASTVTATDDDGHEVPVAHACGHDMHVAWLAAASALFGAHRDTWSGTLVALFQPSEETGGGAQGMVDDGLVGRFPSPDVVLGQHVMPAPAGVVSTRPGTVTSASDVWRIRLFGRGAHGSMPEAAVDPVVMAASTVLRLQTVVSRELGMNEPAVLTVGMLRAGSKENVIPDEATIGLNLRCYDEAVRARAQDAIRRIVAAEAHAAGAPRAPEITPVETYQVTDNDPAATDRVLAAFRGHFEAEQVQPMGPTSASEDYGVLGRSWGAPSVFWFVGGVDRDTYDGLARAGRLAELPTNHSPQFAPVLDPTVRTGIETLVTAAGAWLASG
ncbi:amidohydrolase [Actinomycetospora endophytica]|uniref:Amidohydrolase n=1 Tax=Actinomycetospora endophytica TaxID=2291215 RepID=A0ABS8PFK4_9PSEU|nr:amidohydrolase [Actinomycetospora endophytica]MCD2196783.1 amidohydrolase [Actinomycetospora endophytica]